MTTALRTNHIQDEYERPVPGASIYVYNADGSLAALTSDGTTVIANPLTTDAFGNYSYYALVGFYREDVWFGGKLRWSENNVAVGSIVPLAAVSVQASPDGVGLKTTVPSLTIGTGIDKIGTTGADAPDHGSASYVAGTAPTDRSGVTSANSRNFVLSKEQVIVPQQFYQATDTDFQNAAQGALDYMAAIAGDIVNPWYRSAAKIVFPASATAYDLHAPLEPGYTGIIEGEDTGFHDTHATKLRWAAGNSSGFRYQDINTTLASGTSADHFAPSGSILRNIFLEGGLGTVSTEGEYHAVHARTRVIIENVGVSKWQGDGINVTADVSAPSKGEASLSQISRCRILHTRNGIALIGADANIITVQSNDVVYARRWGGDFRDFLGVNPIGNHTAGCGFFNPGYTPSLSSISGNTYAVVAGQEAGASTNAPSGTTADNAYWYYCYAGGPSTPLNIVAWTSGLTWLAGGPYHVNGAGSPTVLVNCYSETGMGPSQLPYLAMRLGGLHGAGVKGASFGAHNGMPTALKSLAVEKDGDTTTRTVIGSGEDSADGAIMSHYSTLIGGANVLALDIPSYTTDVIHWTNWRGSFADNLVPFHISTNGSSVGNAPWGVNRMNFPLGFGFGYKKRYPATVTPATARLVGDVDENTAPTATTPLKWITTAAGTPGTQILHYPYLRANPTVGVGYVTGAGAAVTQLTNKSTATPAINNVCGQVTMNNAALAGGAKVSFVVTNSTVAATDTIIVSVASGGTANAYRAAVTAISAGVSFTVTVENITAGSLSEAPVINFAILKAVAA